MDNITGLITTSNPDRVLQLNAAKGAGGPWETLVARLYNSPVNVQPTTVLADFTECTYTSYTTQAVTLGNAFQSTVDGQVHMSGGALTWVGGSPFTVPDTAYGLFITTGAGVLVGAMPFPNPQPITAAAQGFATDIDLTYGA